MAIEVELKFPLPDRSLVEQKLSKLEQSNRSSTTQVDCYYAHPCRDFAVTDEALRLRRVGDVNYITYKGPKLDSATKTRARSSWPCPMGRQRRPKPRNWSRPSDFGPLPK